MSSVIFRLLNFGVVIAFFVYIFKRSLKADIQQDITHKEKQLQFLKEQRDQLKEQLKNLENTLNEQETTSKDLALKVARWHDIYHATIAQKEADKERLNEVLLVRAQQQSDTLTTHSIQKAIFPEVIKESHKKLEHHFKDPQAGEQFLQSLLLFMERSKPS